MDDYSDYTIFSFDGRLFHLNRDMISRDTSHPHTFGLDEWWAMRAKHSNWCAGVIVSARAICPRDIIVLEYTMNGLTHRNWFIRSNFKCPSVLVRGAPAGGYILWQLPHPMCMSMIVALEEYQRNMASTGEQEHPLVTNMFYPTCSVFRPEDHDGTGTALCTQVTEWDRQLEILSVRGNDRLGYPLDEGQDVYYENLRRELGMPRGVDVRAVISYARPNRFQPKGSGCFNELADDMAELVIGTVTNSLIEGSKRTDTMALLMLRRVDKRFKREVDKIAIRWAKDKYDQMDKSLHSLRVEPLQKIGQSLRDSGICVCFPYTSWTENQRAKRDGRAEKPVTFAMFLEWKQGKLR